MNEEASNGSTEIPFELDGYSYAIQDPETGIKFKPPLFKQRYAQVFTTLLAEKWRHKIKKVIDFGCAEFGLFLYLKRLKIIEEILCVDIDEALLSEHCYRIGPLLDDYLMKRTCPLNVMALQGSVADPDPILLGTDAVIAVELIEHLYPDTLEGFVYNVFSYIQPRLAIVTTPNSDFNALFDKPGFRHYDHKFEWSRQQFEDWALNITIRFPQYEVYFVGIGHGPPGSEIYGCCSQMAVFIKKDNEIDVSYLDKQCRPKKAFGICTYFTYSVPTKVSNDLLGSYYKLVRSVKYPYEIDDRSPEEKTLNEIRSKINTYMTFGASVFYNEESDRFEIPVNKLTFDTMHTQFASVGEVRNILTKFGYNIEQCQSESDPEPVPCVVCDIHNKSSDSDLENENGYYASNYSEVCVCEDEESWD